MTDREPVLGGPRTKQPLQQLEDFIGRLGAEFGLEPNEFLGLSNDFRSLAEFYRLGTLALHDSGATDL
jgi:hypothetical protein